MKQFTDSNGAAWSVKITIGAAERVRDNAGVDLLDLTATAADREADQANGKSAEPLGQQLTTNPALFAKVLWAVLEPQAVERQVSREAFFDGLDGAAFAAAFNAFFDEIIDFFQNAGRPAVSTMIQKQLAYLVAGNKLAHAKAETIDIPRAIAHATERVQTIDMNRLIEKEIDARVMHGARISGNLPE